jgi:Dynamin family
VNNAQKERLVQTLERCATRLREARLPGEVAADLERVAGQVDEPCVLAVVGRMKAGKSTFVNALLGEEVATVGTRETTATINHFRYGNPADPDRPVRCRLRSGADEYVSVAFLESLQGTTVEGLRRADNIEYLEYLLPNPYLRDVTLVDTPGTGAVVGDHQDRTAEFRNLENQLRDRHAQETQRIGSKADAVIYLVGAVPRSTDQAFLEEFSQATGGSSRALNAIGVMAKIDLQAEILARRMPLAAKMSEQLKDSLNTVVPVSAGICRTLHRLRANQNAELIRWMTTLRPIPAKRLAKLLDDDQLYLGDYEDCPVTAEERERLLGKMDWGVFTTVARLAADPALSEQAIVERLDELAGFGPLQKVLERHFFQRARFLRCYRIANDARKIVNDIRYRHLPDFRKRDQVDKDQRERFLGFVHSANGDQVVAKELEHFISLTCGTAARADRLDATVKEVDRELATLFHEMEEYNAEFAAWEELDQSRQLFSPAEIEELRCLLGLNGVELEKRLGAGQATVARASERQQEWSEVSQRARESVRRRVAERAQARYGLILYDLTRTEGW